MSSSKRLRLPPHGRFYRRSPLSSSQKWLFRRRSFCGFRTVQCQVRCRRWGGDDPEPLLVFLHELADRRLRESCKPPQSWVSQHAVLFWGSICSILDTLWAPRDYGGRCSKGSTASSRKKNMTAKTPQSGLRPQSRRSKVLLRTGPGSNMSCERSYLYKWSV